MSFIQDISINIARGTKPLTQAGFGLPLIIGSSTPKDGHTQQVCKEFANMEEIAAAYESTTDEYKMAEAMFMQNPCPKTVVIYSKATDETTVAALTACQASGKDFWGVCISERTVQDAENEDAGKWCSANNKFFFGFANDTDGTEIAKIAARNYDREAYIVHDKAGDFPECAWVGQNLPKDPGSITWKWKSLNGQNAAEYDSAKLTSIRDAKAQALTEYGGIVYVNEGKSTGGDYIDVMRGQDFVKARIEENLYRLFISNDKISMDNTGIAQVEGVVRSVLKHAGNMDIIAKATTESELEKSDDKEYMYRVTVPLREEISENDRAARKLPYVEFIYYLAGAIHEAEIKGKIKA